MSACGFALRGSHTPLVPLGVYVQNEGQPTKLQYLLEQRLRSSASLSGDANATLRLRLYQRVWQDRLLALIDGERSQLIRLSLEYGIDGQNGEPVFAKRRVSFERTLRTNDNELLQGEARAERLKEEMLSLAVQNILADLNAANLKIHRTK